MIYYSNQFGWHCKAEYTVGLALSHLRRGINGLGLGNLKMYDKNDLALRVANRVNPNSLLGLSDESLLKWAKDAASAETLDLSAKVNNTDTFQFSIKANYNASFQATFLKIADALHSSDVLNQAVELLKERRET